MIGGNIHALFPHQIFEDTAAQRPEVARQDQIVIFGRKPRIFKMREKAVRRGGRHRGAHIVDVGHAEIHDLPESGGVMETPSPLFEMTALPAPVTVHCDCGGRVQPNSKG